MSCRALSWMMDSMVVVCSGPPTSGGPRGSTAALGTYELLLFPRCGLASSWVRLVGVGLLPASAPGYSLFHPLDLHGPRLLQLSSIDVRDPFSVSLVLCPMPHLPHMTLLPHPRYHLDFGSLLCRFPLSQPPMAVDCVGRHVLIASEPLEIALFEVQVKVGGSGLINMGP